MAYQQPTAFFSKPTELSSEDFLNGVRTQDAAETFRRKRALADAFSASITTKPVIADSDIYDANGNRTQTKGDILARPGDVDQQKFFEHSAKAGLGFDEAKAVYDHYDMQKKAALSALNTGLSEEEFKKELQTIEQTLMQARDRIKTGNFIKQDVQQAQPSTVGRFKIEVE